ncbi:class I SAM-dependent methyltransferase [Saccharopolyspora sp. NPDC050642]|uniref:class I SAM-dependent methyltransferase n=1 Tax=Saccharopolyspora sp. NPDC050642 TaxID=3157099 RepID=UPI0033DC7316
MAKHDVAARYDLMNTVLSLGQAGAWRKAVVAAVGARSGERVLDLAAGTATSSTPLAAEGTLVVPCDFSLGMLAKAKKRRPELLLVAGDATRFPFADGVFDAMTISFGLRNVQHADDALREMLRVTRSGGRIVVCELSHPAWPPFRLLCTKYLVRALPPLAALSSNPAAYGYLTESISAWDDQPALARRMQRAGWSRVEWRNLTGGIVALHRGYAT